MEKRRAASKNHVPNQRLREERERNGYAHKDVADFIGLPDPHTVGRWERGVSFPQPHYRQKLCQLFGKSAEELGLVRTRASEEPSPSNPSLSPVSRQSSLWNVPTAFTSFIGREREVRAVTSLLARDDVRLVTLLGPGGVGKTRLSLQVANALRSQFADGVCFISLAAISDPALILPAIAQGLGMQES